MKQAIIDDCLRKVDNRFELVMLVSYRVKQLKKRHRPLVDVKDEKNILVSMREIAEGKVFIVNEEQNENE
jgi:DNA-directed RNA polymerase subunit omega